MPQELLTYTPLYCLVGVYRLATDQSIRIPVWDKCRHGVRRGAIIGVIWALVTFNIQRMFIRFFLVNSPRVVALSGDNFMGFKVPLATYATIIFLSSQVTQILKFCLSKNLGIARTRAWDQTVASRGKDAQFWGPYVEEWQNPPIAKVGGRQWEKWIGGYFGRYIIRQALVVPFSLLVPFAGLFIGAGLKAVSMSTTLHQPYFSIKRMTATQVATFMEEHKWDYYFFGFTAALLESVPFLGLAFSVSNKIGAAMWAFDLEKRQALFRAGALRPDKHERLGLQLGDGTSEKIDSDMAGGWSKVQ